jgi:hypothetical protein
MQTNTLPVYDQSENTTGCCPRFKPDAWDGQDLHFDNKLFVRVITRNVMHIPMNMGSVFTHTFDAIETAGAMDPDNFVVLSRDLSPWKGEHLFAVSKPVPNEEMVRLSGDYRTRVFNGPYRDAPKWLDQFEDELEAQDLDADRMYAFYTTCPKCAKAYGENYVVAFAKVEAETD